MGALCGCFLFILAFSIDQSPTKYNGLCRGARIRLNNDVEDLGLRSCLLRDPVSPDSLTILPLISNHLTTSSNGPQFTRFTPLLGRSNNSVLLIGWSLCPTISWAIFWALVRKAQHGPKMMLTFASGFTHLSQEVLQKSMLKVCKLTKMWEREKVLTKVKLMSSTCASSSSSSFMMLGKNPNPGTGTTWSSCHPQPSKYSSDE